MLGCCCCLAFLGIFWSDCSYRTCLLHLRACNKLVNTLVVNAHIVFSRPKSEYTELDEQIGMGKILYKMHVNVILL